MTRKQIWLNFLSFHTTVKQTVRVVSAGDEGLVWPGGALPGLISFWQFCQHNYVNTIFGRLWQAFWQYDFGNIILSTWFLIVCGEHFGNMIIERYQDMRAEDPAQAEDFKKQMTERFQMIDVSGDGDDSEEYKDKDGY